jgi:hypothetical protein
MVAFPVLLLLLLLSLSAAAVIVVEVVSSQGLMPFVTDKYIDIVTYLW